MSSNCLTGFTVDSSSRPPKDQKPLFSCMSGEAETALSSRKEGTDDSCHNFAKKEFNYSLMTKDQNCQSTLQKKERERKLIDYL